MFQGYQEAFDIHKIQGYHYLTTKMQNTLNQKFMSSLNKCHGDMDAMRKENEKLREMVEALSVRINEREELEKIKEEQQGVEKSVLVTLEKRIDSNENHIKLLQVRTSGLMNGFSAPIYVILRLKSWL